ncbi:DUF2225 domain-containing protein [Pseudoalteromonas sp. MMG022]|uniref:DUF2225 domain-containing protein n=1 Tax=Pseudoalteromonas sp. MMG022 TaxID=2909978 RepID=UPI001F20D773|nr:DUF2225 domain-containing protein [Pseudoalteromonas sp. MMG022]MCF6436785.1 DUF2225 domain-containing protein [Pseudoalteromonas sp. MMG022]
MKYIYLFIYFFTLTVSATTWHEKKVDDPIKPGAKCSVLSVGSYGSYIYNFPSKYDQVFFPYTASHAMWFCEESGYISFIRDFESITEQEKEKIAAYLKLNPPKDIRSLLSKLELIEKIYSFRTLLPEHSNQNKRILAYLYEQKDKFDIANNYRKAALTEIYELLKTDLTEYRKLEYLYLSANYERQLGNITKSDEQLAILAKEIEQISNEKLQHFGNYLSQLMSETVHIKPGGKLNPKVREEHDDVSELPEEINDKIQNVSNECRAEVQTRYNDLTPLFDSHIEQITIEKEIEEFLVIRSLFIETNNIPKHILDDYSNYKGAASFRSAINNLNTKHSQSCMDEVSHFTDQIEKEFTEHMTFVTQDLTRSITRRIKQMLEKDNPQAIRTLIDEHLIDKSIRQLYCREIDYDISFDVICPDKSMPYKSVFEKLSAHIFHSPLLISDQEQRQKLTRGLSSIGL